MLSKARPNPALLCFLGISMHTMNLGARVQSVDRVALELEHIVDLAPAVVGVDLPEVGEDRDDLSVLGEGCQDTPSPSDPCLHK